MESIKDWQVGVCVIGMAFLGYLFSSPTEQVIIPVGTKDTTLHVLLPVSKVSFPDTCQGRVDVCKAGTNKPYQQKTLRQRDPISLHFQDGTSLLTLRRIPGDGAVLMRVTVYKKHYHKR